MGFLKKIFGKKKQDDLNEEWPDTSSAPSETTTSAEEPIAPAVEEPIAPAAEEPIAPAAEEPIAPAAEEPITPVTEDPDVASGVDNTAGLTTPALAAEPSIAEREIEEESARGEPEEDPDMWSVNKDFWSNMGAPATSRRVIAQFRESAKEDLKAKQTLPRLRSQVQGETLPEEPSVEEPTAEEPTAEEPTAEEETHQGPTPLHPPSIECDPMPSMSEEPAAEESAHQGPTPLNPPTISCDPMPSVRFEGEEPNEG